MPLDEHGVPKRTIDLDLFVQDGAKRSKARAKQGDIGFLLGSKERPKPITIEEDDGLLAAQLRWAKLVADGKILKTNQRDKLKAHLDDLLDGLNVRYITGRPTTFPSNFELTKLTQVIFALARVIGVKKTDYGDLEGAAKRVESRFSKVSIFGFADRLCDRLCQLPMCPASVVHQASGERTMDTTTKKAVTKFLTTGELDSQNISWENWHERIRGLDFSTSALTTNEATELLQSTGTVKQRNQITRLLLMDLRRQQLEWDRRYAKAIEPSLQWLYLLQRPDDYTRLTKAFCGSAAAPMTNAKSQARIDNAIRQKRHRKKHHTA